MAQYTCPYCTKSQGVGLPYGWSTCGLEPETSYGYLNHVRTCPQRPQLKSVEEKYAEVLDALKLVTEILERHNIVLKELKAAVSKLETDPEPDINSVKYWAGTYVPLTEPDPWRQDDRPPYDMRKSPRTTWGNIA